MTRVSVLTTCNMTASSRYCGRAQRQGAVAGRALVLRALASVPRGRLPGKERARGCALENAWLGEQDGAYLGRESVADMVQLVEDLLEPQLVHWWYESTQQSQQRLAGSCKHRRGYGAGTAAVPAAPRTLVDDDEEQLVVRWFA